MTDDGKKARCPSCGCFLECEESNIGVDEDCYSHWYNCNNKKCDWKEPIGE